ncbi:hypothetical protein [Actinokineospora sp. NPDC004072]
MTTPREELARQQSALLHALLTDTPPPPGFDPRMLAIESAALLAKRRRINTLVDPETAATLGDDYRPLFDTYAKAHPRPSGTRARADAANFRAWALPTHPRRRWWQRKRPAN